MGELLLWCAALTVLVILFAVVAYRVKRRYLDASVSGGDQMLDLDHLQRMHDRGTLTAEEFRALREQVVRQMRTGQPPARP